MPNHIPAGSPGGEKHPGEVDVDDLSPLGKGHFRRGHVQANPRVAEGAVQPAQVLDELLHHGIHLRLLRNIHLVSADDTPRGLGDFGGGLLRGCNVHIQQGHVAAGFGQRSGNGFPNAPSSACHEAPFSV